MQGYSPAFFFTQLKFYHYLLINDTLIKDLIYFTIRIKLMITKLQLSKIQAFQELSQHTINQVYFTVLYEKDWSESYLSLLELSYYSIEYDNDINVAILKSLKQTLNLLIYYTRINSINYSNKNIERIERLAFKLELIYQTNLPFIDSNLKIPGSRNLK